jgi:predicted porin
LKSASSTALFAALGLIALGAGAPAAKAADLGGDCCSDLEERVAELEATTARKGNRKVSLTISGQVTTGLMAWDNGVTRDVYVVDPPVVGGTLFNLQGNAKISPSLTAGFHIQVGLDQGARSHQVSEKTDDGTATGDTTMVMTLANWYLDHKSLGRVTVGRITTATAGVSGIDLGGASVIANVNVGYWQRSFSVTGVAGATGAWNTLLGGADVNGSTLSRANAISYTSPTFGGFSVSAAWGENDIWDAALRYAGEFGGFRIAAGVGYINNSGGLNEITPDFAPAGTATPGVWKGSASILHVGSGLFATAAFVDKDNDNDNPNTRLYYLQGGIAKNWTGLGNTVLYGEYARVTDGLNCKTGFIDPKAKEPVANCAAFGGNEKDQIGSSEATVWGFGVVQHIDAAAMELYLSYRRYSGEYSSSAGGGGKLSGTIDVNDFDVVMGGARIKF